MFYFQYMSAKQYEITFFEKKNKNRIYFLFKFERK